jgi:hypothetical protein
VVGVATSEDHCQYPQPAIEQLGRLAAEHGAEMLVANTLHPSGGITQAISVAGVFSFRESDTGVPLSSKKTSSPGPGSTAYTCAKSM